MHFNASRAKRLRKERGLTQVALAEAVGVISWSIQNWEYGNFSPNGRNLVALAHALGVDAEELLEQTPASGEPKTGDTGKVHRQTVKGVNSDGVR